MEFVRLQSCTKTGRFTAQTSFGVEVGKTDNRKERTNSLHILFRTERELESETSPNPNLWVRVRVRICLQIGYDL